MHDAALRYVASVVEGKHYPRVVEIGGRNVNGGIRQIVSAEEYLSIDLEDGPEVDVVGDCRDWEPPWDASLVLCCEVLEHAPEAREVVDAAISYLRPGGRLIVTCAGPGRIPHSGHDGGPIQANEWYENIDPDDLEKWLTEDLEAVRVRYNGLAKDVYATGIKC